ncbi:MAG: Smr/MutS family protein [Pseudomonadota bacterium]|nr:Smr/MutS family protein [Pseudomonadota bacterium]
MVRKLGPEESALWEQVARTIRPLKPTDSEKGSQERDQPPPLLLDPIPQLRPASPRALELGDGLDGGWERRLRGGTIEPDQTLDLHGMNLDTAWAAIDRLLDRAWTRRQRVVLLVTGRERPDGERGGRGRIRAAVRDWLAASRHAPHIAAVRAAHRRHGGAGSLYLILRRN